MSPTFWISSISSAPMSSQLTPWQTTLSIKCRGFRILWQNGQGRPSCVQEFLFSWATFDLHTHRDYTQNLVIRAVLFFVVWHLQTECEKVASAVLWWKDKRRVPENRLQFYKVRFKSKIPVQRQARVKAKKVHLKSHWHFLSFEHLTRQWRVWKYGGVV